MGQLKMTSNETFKFLNNFCKEKKQAVINRETKCHASVGLLIGLLSVKSVDIFSNMHHRWTQLHRSASDLPACVRTHGRRR